MANRTSVASFFNENAKQPSLADGLTDVDCPLCGGTEKRPLIRKSGYQLSTCRECGLVYQSPRMTDAARRAAWSGKPNAAGKSFLEHYQAGVSWRNDLAEKRLATLAMKGFESGAMLDVGCATGIFLNIARQKGFEVTGSDVSPELAEFGRSTYGLDIFQGDILETDFGGRKFDVITAFDVFSSLSRPLESLEALRKLLKPDGMLWLTASCANIGLWFFKEANPFNFYVSAKTMKKFLERSGFGESTVKVIVKNANMPELHGWKKNLFSIPVVNSVFKKMVEVFARP